MTEESLIKRQICDYLSKLPNCFFTLNPRGDANRKSSKYMVKGYPVLSGVIRVNGAAMPFFIEVKTPIGKVSAEQTSFLLMAERLGCVAFVARDVTEVVRVFNGLLGLR